MTNARTRVQLCLTTLGVALAWLPITAAILEWWRVRGEAFSPPTIGLIVILMYSQIGHYASPATKGFHRRWIILKDRRVATIDDGYYSAEF